MTKLMLSIIVPIYNSQAYLEKCIKSILSQTFENFELFLINDGSTDESGKICDEFALQDKRIKVFHQENQGQANARNVGLKEAKGEWIGFVDSDDWCEKEMFEILLRNAIEKEVDFCVCGFKDIYEDGTITKNYTDKIKSGYMNSCEALSILLSKYYFILCWNSIVKRDILAKNCIYFDSKFRLGEDTLFTYKVLKIVDKFYVSTSLLYNHLQRSISQSNYAKIGNKELGALEVLDTMALLEKDDYLKKSIKACRIMQTFSYALHCMVNDRDNPHYKTLIKYLKDQFISAMVTDRIILKHKIFIIFSFFPKAFLAILKIKAFFRRLLYRG